MLKANQFITPVPV